MQRYGLTLSPRAAIQGAPSSMVLGPAILNPGIPLQNGEEVSIRSVRFLINLAASAGGVSSTPNAPAVTASLLVAGGPYDQLALASVALPQTGGASGWTVVVGNGSFSGTYAGGLQLNQDVGLDWLDELQLLIVLSGVGGAYSSFSATVQASSYARLYGTWGVDE